MILRGTFNEHTDEIGVLVVGAALEHGYKSP